MPPDLTVNIPIFQVLTYLFHGAVHLEKLTCLQLVKKFPAFHGTRRFITALTSVRHLSLSWARPIQSIYPHPTSWRSVLILSTHLRLGLPYGLLPSSFPTKTLYTPLSSPIRTTCPAHLILFFKYNLSYLSLFVRESIRKHKEKVAFSFCFVGCTDMIAHRNLGAGALSRSKVRVSAWKNDPNAQSHIMLYLYTTHRTFWSLAYSCINHRIFNWFPLPMTQQPRTPLDERSARRRDLYLTTHNTHKRQTPMP